MIVASEETIMYDLPKDIYIGNTIFLAAVYGEADEVKRVWYSDTTVLTVQIETPKLGGSIVTILEMEEYNGKN